MQRTAIAFALCLCCTPTAPAQHELSGTARIKLALKQLQNTGSVLMIAAHPDDENSALLAYLARGRRLRTAYLSLTRGEGGQNLIGPEQGYELGVIRTEELLAARRIDGAEQFFSSAVDFGFSKTAEETLRIWGHAKVLNDIIKVMRDFRPDVVILRFSGTPRDGHGHHQSSAILGKEAFEKLSGDPVRPKRLMWNLFSFSAEQDREASATTGRVAVDTGEFDPVLGFSYSEIAGMSRSMHKSQGFGAAERRGSQMSYLVTVAGEPAAKDLFEGIDTTWNRVPGGTGIGALLAKADAALDPARPEDIIPTLLKARMAAAVLDHPIARRKLGEFDRTIALCAGLWLDAAAPNPVAVEGSSLKVELTALNRSRAALSWDGTPLDYNKPARRTIGMPAAAAASASFWISVAGQVIEYKQPVIYRWVDPVRGELTRPLAAVAPVSLRVPETPLIFPSAAPRAVDVRVTANQTGAAGEVALQLPPGWRATPPKQVFQGSATLRFTVTPPAAAGAGALEAVAVLADDRKVSTGIKVIDYPHIPPQTLVLPAVTKIVRADIRTLAKNIGYVMGAGDEMPQALEQIGCAMTLLTDADLASGNLSRFDAIVTGVRSYETRTSLRTNAKRLLDYVSNGGTLVVQYNTLAAVSAGAFPWGPFPFRLGRSRVTVEEAPIEFVDPQSAVLRVPNVIAPKDFDGWVQERGLYFASEWDPRYKPLFRSNDPGEQPLPGGTLYAPFGKGAYVYTSLAWFRQLPAGVPGAYRVFANLLSSGKARYGQAKPVPSRR